MILITRAWCNGLNVPQEKEKGVHGKRTADQDRKTGREITS